MLSSAYHTAFARLQAHNAALPPSADAPARRSHYEARGSLFTLPDGIVRTAVLAGGRPAEFLAPASGDMHRVVLFLHPGGFAVGSQHSHRPLAAGLAAAARCRVLSLSYRLSPEHPFPAPVEDAVMAYRWLLGLGIDAGDIALCGASAGGAVAASTAMQIRAQARTMKDIQPPAALLLLCPWLDLALTGAPPDVPDPLNSLESLRSAATAYLGRLAPTHPIASPLYGDWAGLPPVHLQAATADVLLDDARRARQRIIDQGGSAALLEQPGACHVWQGFGVTVPEAQAALQAAGAFLATLWEGR